MYYSGSYAVLRNHSVCGRFTKGFCLETGYALAHHVIIGMLCYYSYYRCAMLLQALARADPLGQLLLFIQLIDRFVLTRELVYCYLFLRQILSFVFTCLLNIEHTPAVQTQGQGQSTRKTLPGYLQSGS